MVANEKGNDFDSIIGSWKQQNTVCKLLASETLASLGAIEIDLPLHKGMSDSSDDDISGFISPSSIRPSMRRDVVRAFARSCREVEIVIRTDQKSAYVYMCV